VSNFKLPVTKMCVKRNSQVSAQLPANEGSTLKMLKVTSLNNFSKVI